MSQCTLSVLCHFVALADCIRSGYVGEQLVVTRNIFFLFLFHQMGYRLFTETRFTERQFTERRFTECLSHRQTSSQKTFLTENTFTEDPNTERRLTEYSLHRTKLTPKLPL